MRTVFVCDTGSNVLQNLKVEVYKGGTLVAGGLLRVAGDSVKAGQCFAMGEGIF